MAVLGLAMLTVTTGLAAAPTPAAATPVAAGLSGPRLSWQLSATGITARLRGLAAVGDKVAWAAGSGGVVLRTVDRGASWRRVDPPGAQDLQFRDVEAFDRDHALVLSIGEGDQSRVYRTADGGRTWAETFRNDDPRAFYDCVTFLDRRHGLALSDPVDGRFRVAATADGGRSWRVLPADGMPAALPGEFAFAASGACLVSAPGDGRRAWFATGGADRARVLRTVDGGRAWTASDTAIPSGPSAGIFALAFRDGRHGIAVGGDFAVPASAPDAAAASRDAGRAWTIAAAPPGEYRSGVAWARSSAALAVGPTGSDVTLDGGRTWRRFDSGSFDTVDCAAHTCWATGEQGRAATLRVHAW